MTGKKRIKSQGIERTDWLGDEQTVQLDVETRKNAVWNIIITITCNFGNVILQVLHFLPLLFVICRPIQGPVFSVDPRANATCEHRHLATTAENVLSHLMIDCSIVSIQYVNSAIRDSGKYHMKTANDDDDLFPALNNSVIEVPVPSQTQLVTAATQWLHACCIHSLLLPSHVFAPTNDFGYRGE